MKKVSDGLSEALSKTQVQLLITFGGIVVALLNVWFIARISPLIKDIAVVTTRVNAIEEHQATERVSLNNRLERIENKIDDLLERR